MLIMGIGVSEAVLATLFYVCDTCGNQSAHQVSKLTRRLSIFFIPLIPLGTRYVDRCALCGRELELSREQAETAAQQSGPDLR